MNSRALPHQIFQDPSPSHFEAEGQRSIFPRLDSLVCLLPLGLRLRENRSPVSAAGAPGSNLPPWQSWSWRSSLARRPYKYVQFLSSRLFDHFSSPLPLTSFNLRYFLKTQGQSLKIQDVPFEIPGHRPKTLFRMPIWNTCAVAAPSPDPISFNSWRLYVLSIYAGGPQTGLLYLGLFREQTSHCWSIVSKLRSTPKQSYIAQILAGSKVLFVRPESLFIIVSYGGGGGRR